MKKLLLCLFLCCTLLCVGSVGYAIYFDERLAQDLEERGMEEVFWSHLQYDGIPVDPSMPPPGYDPAEDTNLEYTLANGYKLKWISYFNAEDPELTWNGISFRKSDQAPNYEMWWCGFDTFIAWEFYFTEMFYEGGPAYPMDEETFVQFWSGLRHKGKPVDPFTAPPNYDPEMDYWRDSRSRIGYAWYWEYYLGGHPYDEEVDVTWNGIAFNPYHTPPNYRYPEEYDADMYRDSRMRRGYMPYWAEYFLGEGNP